MWKEINDIKGERNPLCSSPSSSEILQFDSPQPRSSGNLIEILNPSRKLTEASLGSKMKLTFPAVALIALCTPTTSAWRIWVNWNNNCGGDSYVCVNYPRQELSGANKNDSTLREMGDTHVSISFLEVMVAFHDPSPGERQERVVVMRQSTPHETVLPLLQSMRRALMALVSWVDSRATRSTALKSAKTAMIKNNAR